MSISPAGGCDLHQLEDRARVLVEIADAQRPGDPPARGVGVDEQRIARALDPLEEQRRAARAHRLLRERRDLQHRIDLLRDAAELAALFEVADEAGEIVPVRRDGRRVAAVRRRRGGEWRCAPPSGAPVGGGVRQRDQTVAVARGGQGRRSAATASSASAAAFWRARSTPPAARTSVRISATIAGRHPVLAQVLAHAPRQRRIGLAGQQHRQRQLPFLQIVADRLAGRRLVDRAVEHVVGDLERAAQRPPVALERRRPASRRPSRRRARTRRSARRSCDR